jgi:hypothetical protein
MRINSLKTLDLILSLSKDEAKLSGFFSSLKAWLDGYQVAGAQRTARGASLLGIISGAP